MVPDSSSFGVRQRCGAVWHPSSTVGQTDAGGSARKKNAVSLLIFVATGSSTIHHRRPNHELNFLHVPFQPCQPTLIMYHSCYPGIAWQRACCNRKNRARRRRPLCRRLGLSWILPWEQRTAGLRPCCAKSCEIIISQRIILTAHRRRRHYHHYHLNYNLRAPRVTL